MKDKFAVFMVVLNLILLGAIISESRGPQEQFSPSDVLSEDQISVLEDRVVIHVDNPTWARFTDSNSMDPTLDIGTNAIQIIPNCPEDISVGDIITYNRNNDHIIHRVIGKGEDNQGPYFIAKGDNNPTSDSGRIRCDEIERKTIALIY
ncbi:MAG: signal peptidase I [Candidatus Woesearchaeota archaeon]|nr:MAG: signal peptidase I [Candidatus Woesearchaeota archaeon]